MQIQSIDSYLTPHGHLDPPEEDARAILDALPSGITDEFSSREIEVPLLNRRFHIPPSESYGIFFALY